MPSDYIVLRGAPGTGKTTTARLLMQLANRGATIEVDDIRKMINGVVWKSHQQHFDAIYAAAAAAKAYRKCGYQPIVFVDTLAFGSLDIAIEALDSSSVSVYSLVCSRLVLTLRLWRRLGGFRDAAKSALIDTHLRTDGSYPCEILDTTSTGARRIARWIMEREGF
jgi:hypothetical protein